MSGDGPKDQTPPNLRARLAAWVRTTFRGRDRPLATQSGHNAGPLQPTPDSAITDDASYHEAARKLRVGGWRYLHSDDFPALELAAEARRDLATLIFIDLIMGRDGIFSRRLGSTVGPGEWDTVLNDLLSIEPCDELWHLLFEIVERAPALLPRVEKGIQGWPDTERRMPRAWWERMLAGENREYFRLARNAGIEEKQVDRHVVRRHAPCFRWLTEFALENATLDVATLEEFITLPEVRRLKRISLARTGLRDAHATVLARGENLADLQWLDLKVNDISPAGAATLIGDSGLIGLAFLDLTACKLSLRALAHALSSTATRSRPLNLNLSELRNSRDGFAAFVQCEAFKGISGLELYFCELQPIDAEALAESPTATAFKRLQINDGTLGEAGVRAILSSRWISQAEHLNLFNQKGGDGIAPYLQSLSGGAIEKLELLHNDLGPRTAEVLGHINLPSLRALHLSNNPLGDEGVAAILRNPSLTRLEHVKIQNAGAGPKTARAIAENTQLRNLRILWLGDDLGVAGARLLAEAPHLATLADAHLGGVPPSEEAMLRNSRYLRDAFITVYPPNWYRAVGRGLGIS